MVEEESGRGGRWKRRKVEEEESGRGGKWKRRKVEEEEKQIWNKGA